MYNNKDYYGSLAQTAIDAYFRGETKSIIAYYGTEFGWKLIDKISENWTIKRLGKMIHEYEICKVFRV